MSGQWPVVSGQKILLRTSHYKGWWLVTWKTPLRTGHWQLTTGHFVSWWSVARKIQILEAMATGN